MVLPLLAPGLQCAISFSPFILKNGSQEICGAIWSKGHGTCIQRFDRIPMDVTMMICNKQFLVYRPSYVYLATLGPHETNKYHV